MSDNVDSIIFKSGTAVNAGVVVGIAAPSPTVQKLFPLPVLLAAILNFENFVFLLKFSNFCYAKAYAVQISAKKLNPRVSF